MKIAYLTTDDPLYLPKFFERVLRVTARETAAVYVVPPLYKQQTPAHAAWRYYRTFGLRPSIGLGLRVVRSKLCHDTIRSVCRKHQVRHEAVADVNSAEFLEQLRADGVDLVVSVCCPQVFKRPLIELPAGGVLNIHGARLPNYRGVLPSFWMLANNETEAGVSIYFVNEKIDAGELCGQRTFPIGPDERLDGFLRRSKAIAADLLLEVLEKIRTGTVHRQPMNLAEGSYYSWPDAAAVRRFQETGRRLW